jgi:proteasome lid subunit RPN8/RPN11
MPTTATLTRPEAQNEASAVLCAAFDTPDAIKEAIWAHTVAEAIKQPAKEACGVIIKEGEQQVVVPCRNVAFYDKLNPRHSFRIAREDLERAEDRGEILACYHSHIYGNPNPSDGDKTVSERTGVPFVIVNWPTKTWAFYSPCGWRAELVGRPYFYGILDCYTLIQDYYREKLQIELPEFARGEERWWEKGENLYLDNCAKAGFVILNGQPPRLHDIILMQMWPSMVANHAAIYLGDGHILHHLTNRPSAITTYLVNDGEYAKATRAIVRHKSLC